MRRLIPALTLAAALAGCSGDNAGSNDSTVTPTTPPAAAVPAPGVAEPPLIDPNPNVDITEIPVDSVEIVIRESSPPQVAAQVKGTLGDGCAELKEIVQKRNGNTIEITVTAARPRDAMCTAIAKGFDQAIDLEGDFAPGEYLVVVNGVEQRFKI